MCIGVFFAVAAVFKDPAQRETIQREEKNITREIEIAQEPKIQEDRFEPEERKVPVSGDVLEVSQARSS